MENREANLQICSTLCHHYNLKSTQLLPFTCEKTRFTVAELLRKAAWETMTTCHSPCYSFWCTREILNEVCCCFLMLYYLKLEGFTDRGLVRLKGDCVPIMIKYFFKDKDILSCIDSDLKVHQNSSVQE